MIDKILPGEIRRHDAEFAERNENKRRVLRTTQANDVARLEEKLKALTWKNMRQCEREFKMYNMHILLRCWIM